MDKLDHLGWVASRSYRVGNVIFGARTTSESFAAWMDESLGAYRSDEEVDPYFSVVVAEPDKSKTRSVKEFNILYRSTSMLVRSLHLPTVTRQLISEIETFLYPERDDGVYASVVPISSSGSLALVPAGFASYIGDLGRKVRRAGLTLPVASAVLIEPDSGRVLPPPRLLELPGDALARLSELVASNGNADRVTIDEPLSPNVILTGFGGGQMTLEPLSPARALYALTGSIFNLEKIGKPALDGLAKLVENVPCYALSGSAEDMLQAVKTALRAA